MAGGLLNLVAYGNQNIIINGNPDKSFFKIKYLKHTNFGMQKYRVDHEETKDIDLNKESSFTFTMPRNGELLMNVFLVFKLPKIWSPIFNMDSNLRPYEFKWIKNIGTQIIKEVKFTIGNTEVQKFSGAYLQNVVERDFDAKKKELFDLMIGNTNELNDPANYLNRNNYPNAYKSNDTDISGIEPSIYDKIIYVPINSWFSILNSSALPLICMQYDILKIDFIFRPIKELFTVKNIYASITDTSYVDIKADQTDEVFLYKRFVNEPPQRDISGSPNIYASKRENINFDIHLITTECFLDNEERLLFANNNQSYLIKQVKTYIERGINKTNKIKVETNGLVSNWMWYLQRSDVGDRNQWSNYTNWRYENIIPHNVRSLPDSSNIYITGNVPDTYSEKNFKNILIKFGIICDGASREDDFDSGIYDKIEKYIHTNGNTKDGLYHYSFALNTDSSKYQPTGAFNTSKFKTIEFEYNLKIPPLNKRAVTVTTTCDPITGEVIGTSQEPTSIYQYSYDLHLFEERYNILEFHSGTAQLLYLN
jgi:hypothetical protein